MTLDDILIPQLKRHEGFRGKPYLDVVGMTTIGYGRNLDANPLTEDEGQYLLLNDLHRAVAGAESFPWYAELNDARKAVIVNMIFNIGVLRFKGFKKTIAAIEEGRYAVAAKEMMDSQWAAQVKNRAVELASIMATGIAG